MIILFWALMTGAIVFVFSLVLYRCVFYKHQMLEEQLDTISRMGNSVFTEEQEFVENKPSRIKTRWFSGRISGSFRQTVVCMGIGISAESLIMLWAAAAFGLPVILYALFSNMLLAVLGVVIGVFGPFFAIVQMKKRGIERFEKQLSSALLLVGNSLKCGFSFQQALKRVSQDMPDPIAGEFRQALAEMEYGGSMENALTGIATRWESRELLLLNSAVKLQQKAGGSLVEVIDAVVEIIRKRVKMRGMVRSLSAQGKVSGVVVGGLPIFLVTVLSVVDKMYRQTVFYTMGGNLMLCAVAVIEVMGFLCIYKIVNIKIS